MCAPKVCVLVVVSENKVKLGYKQSTTSCTVVNIVQLFSNKYTIVIDVFWGNVSVQESYI